MNVMCFGIEIIAFCGLRSTGEVRFFIPLYDFLVFRGFSTVQSEIGDVKNHQPTTSIVVFQIIFMLFEAGSASLFIQA